MSEQEQIRQEMIRFTNDVKNAVLTAKIDISIDPKKDTTQTRSYNNGVMAAVGIIDTIIEGIKTQKLI